MTSYSEIGKYKEALECYLTAISLNPYYAEAYCNIGVIYKTSGNIEEAISYYGKALAINPNFIIARNNMAIALTDFGTKLKTEGNPKEGIRRYKEALLYNSQYADAYYNLGVAYGEQRKYNKAIVYYELAIHFNPMCCQAFNNLGVIYKDQENLEKSIQCYRAALIINPNFSQTLNNIGVVYTVQGKMDEAYASMKAAIRENPNYGEAYNNLGVLYRDEGKIDKSIYYYRKCLEVSPLSRNASQNLLLSLNYSTWHSLEEIYEEHTKWGEKFQQLFKQTFKHKVEKKANRILRIGYISPDFYTHSVSYFIHAILENHSSNFHITCYSNTVREDKKTEKLKKLPNVWKSITGQSPEEVAAMIVEDKIDILVELTGHTAGNRLDVMALKPAPIQITYIGYPNTTGLKNIDYRIVDEITDSYDTKQKHTEKLIRLPKCFLCYKAPSEAGPSTPLPFLKNQYITFGSFNNLAKINDDVIKLWSQILLSVPNSHFLIKAKPFSSRTIKENFVQKFVKFGIDPSRIDVLPLLPNLTDHLQSYRLMDLSLDTFPYAGTTTTCESLWMGVPVVTLRGTAHSQNVSSSLLSAIGSLDGLIANNMEEYIEIAVSLANDIVRLQELRISLREKMKNSPLCDGMTFTRNLEKTYISLWNDFLKREKNK